MSDKAEEILEYLWIATQERGEDGVSITDLKTHRDAPELGELISANFIDLSGDEIKIREEGKEEAEHTLRRHRLAERLMIDVFDISYPNKSLRTRRDYKKYLGLIRAIAFLYQYQRKVKTMEVEGEPLEYIEVTLNDIDKANKLANEVLGQSLDELAKPSRTLLSSIYKMVREVAEKQDFPLEDVYFTRRMIREHIGWTDWQVRAHIKQLEDMEYVYVRIGARGKEYAMPSITRDRARKTISVT